METVRYRDKHGTPLHLMQWAILCENEEYRRIGSTDFPDGSWISTIWMGMDFLGGAMFETALFKDGEFAEVLGRPRTLEDAIAFHDMKVAEREWKDQFRKKL